MTYPHPFQGWFAIRGLALAMFSLSPIWTYSTSICPQPHWGRRHCNFTDFWHQKLEFLAIIWRCLRDPRFSCFGTISVRDRQTDRQTHNNSVYRTSIASCGKNLHELNRQNTLNVLRQMENIKCTCQVQANSISNFICHTEQLIFHAVGLETVHKTVAIVLHQPRS